MYECTWSIRAVLIIILSTITHVDSTGLINSSESCGELYKHGEDAYLESRFQDCIVYFEGALEKYRSYKKQLQHCRLKCAKEADDSDHIYPIDLEHLHFYENAIKNTFCILRCKFNNQGTFGKFNLDLETEKGFVEGKPYEYLHICYYQINSKQKAASAAFTYIIAHPDDKVMIKNLKHYASMSEVQMNDVINYEAKDYVYLYLHGTSAYKIEEWDAVQNYMEESLVSYFQSEEECRADCEGPFNQGWYPDFVPAIANHFTYSLRCKRRCKVRLASLNGDIRDNLLSNHYHYLQFAYYKLGKVKEACQAAISYLLFFPNDATMLTNVEFYEKMPEAKDEYFRPRPEAETYIQRDKYEEKLLNYIDAFAVDKDAKDAESIGDTTDKVIPKKINSSVRFLEDEVISKRECKVILDIARLFAIPGDGYNLGTTSPHTSLERFEGFSISRGVLLVYFHQMDPKMLELYLKVTDVVKKHVEDYFGLEKLYYTYTHLVCRSAIPGAQENRTDLSHAIHSDNCNLLEDGGCRKEPPAYTWRDYSAILYLNDDFKGGEFMFVKDFYGLNIESKIKPSCGRLIGFSSGKENLHGVNAVKRGSRCAIGIWFTLDKNHEEREREYTYEILGKKRPES